jgi:hypothetical protein
MRRSSLYTWIGASYSRTGGESGWKDTTPIAHGHPVPYHLWSTEPVFVNLLMGPAIDSQPGRPVRQPTWRTDPPGYKAGGMDTLESIPWLLKLLQIPALYSNYFPPCPKGYSNYNECWENEKGSLEIGVKIILSHFWNKHLSKLWAVSCEFGFIVSKSAYIPKNIFLWKFKYGYHNNTHMLNQKPFRQTLTKSFDLQVFGINKNVFLCLMQFRVQIKLFCFVPRILGPKHKRSAFDNKFFEPNPNVLIIVPIISGPNLNVLLSFRL